MGKIIGIVFILLAILDDDTKERIKKFFSGIFGNKSENDKYNKSFPDLQKTVGGKTSGTTTGTTAGTSAKAQTYKTAGRQETYVRPVIRRRGGRLKTIAAYGLFGVSAITFWNLLVDVFSNIAASKPLLGYANLVPWLIFSIVCLIAGIWLLYSKKHQFDRENRYIAIINQGYGMIPIDNICSQFPVKYDTCVQELQEMINKGILPGAYIDYSRRLLVLDRNNSSVEPIINYSKDAAAETASGKSKKAKGKKKVSEQKIDFLSLERLSKQVRDEDIKLKLIRISTTLKTIGQKAEEDPEIMKNSGVTTFMDMYLPKTIKLVEDYEEVNSMDEVPANSELKQNILDTLDAIDDAAMTLWQDIIHSDMIDISSELDALQTKLILDGYKKSELEPDSTRSEFTFDNMDVSEEHHSVSAEHAQLSDAEDAARKAEEMDAEMEADLFRKLRAEQAKEKETLK